MHTRHETWSAPQAPERGNMQRATVALSVVTGMAKLDLRWSQRYQAAWCVRERSILGTPLNVAWRKLERATGNEQLRALLHYEWLIDSLAPPIDTREYAPDTAREIKRDAREAVIQSRRNTGRTDKLPPTENRGTAENESWDAASGTWKRAPHGRFDLPKQSDLSDTLGQSSVQAMHGIMAKVSRNDAYAIVEHCIELAKAGDVTTLTNTIKVSREVLSAYGYLGERDKHTHRFNGLLGTVFASLSYTARRKVAKELAL